MRDVKPDRLGAVPSSTGGIARLACERVRKAGKDPAQLVSRAGLTLEAIDDPSHRLAVDPQIKLLEAAARELQDEHLGFHLAQDFDLRQIGLLYYVMASSECLAEALRHAERYCSLNNEGVRIRVNFDRAIVVTLEYVNVERGSDRHQIEFWFVALIRVCRHLTSRRLTPRKIRARHHRVRVPLDVRAFLGCSIDFDASTDEIVFAAADASLPSVGADVYLNRLLLKYANEALGRRKPPQSSLRFRVEELIVQLLPHGMANAEGVAARLGTSRRTLARGLAAEGATFSELLDRLRAALAKRYLRERELSISQIAWLLGYRETSSFTNAFARWTGSTPGRFRADHDISRPVNKRPAGAGAPS
jgi:AraC-like DNA-binding protein